MTIRDEIMAEERSTTYARPRLTVYGDMSALTAASSNKTQKENSGSGADQSNKNRI